ncbi:MAG: putative radical SAM protein [Candidatus Scalindua rubra]|uniref:Putative radical SAM protein n=1 Tax=Candidatus Scalindua rubra TaxID=1872076 RepID=A0A1E3X8F5_9BACT|nr:MAG: putative radical SAM protein [Candidatus Scalindua rubra]
MTILAIQKTWLKTHRYYPFSYFLKENFPFKVHKISIHAGFTCPNRDGLAGVGGCTYCANESFSPNARKAIVPIKEQVEKGIKFLKRRYGAEKFIAYFQAFTNTYADVETLKTRYEEALLNKDIIGISIGTRPDCITDEILDIISNYTKKYHVWIEYGLQSIHDRTLQLVNRGHDYKAFEDAVIRTKNKKNIKICAHVILGLPGEDWNDMMETAQAVSSIGLDGIKLHHLYIAKNTAMANEYLKGNIKTMKMEEYVSLVCDFLERISPDIVIQRLVGDTHGNFLISPVWNVSKGEVFSAITNELKCRNSYQGAKCALCPTLHQTQVV